MRVPKGADPVEFRAAALYAAFEDCHDDDAVIDDRLTSRCLAHMLGMRDLTPRARAVYELYLEMIAP
jgi:hypothetical protein